MSRKSNPVQSHSSIVKSKYKYFLPIKILVRNAQSTFGILSKPIIKPRILLSLNSFLEYTVISITKFLMNIGILPNGHSIILKTIKSIQTSTTKVFLLLRKSTKFFMPNKIQVFFGFIWSITDMIQLNLVANLQSKRNMSTHSIITFILILKNNFTNNYKFNKIGILEVLDNLIVKVKMKMKNILVSREVTKYKT